MVKRICYRPPKHDNSNYNNHYNNHDINQNNINYNINHQCDGATAENSLSVMLAVEKWCCTAVLLHNGVVCC